MVIFTLELNEKMFFYRKPVYIGGGVYSYVHNSVKMLPVPWGRRTASYI